MHYRETIFKRGNRYETWTGKPATETQYLDYLRKMGVKDIYLDVQQNADKQLARFEAAPVDEEWLYVPIVETDIPSRAALLSFYGQDATLGNLTGTQKGLQQAPGIGPVAAGKINIWMKANYGIPIP